MESRLKERSGAQVASKMANFKKKQDDKNLKTLRELASLPCNKQCFDCYQKGPTYVDMTIGSFVCTTCSGLLRGLNPPHRVKSISMATFTPDEIDFIKGRGNEYCRNVWMGRYDKARGLDEGSFKDETQMKDYLNLKYEKKRWYVSPAEAVAVKPPEQPNARTPAAPVAENATLFAMPQSRSRPAQPSLNKPVDVLFNLDMDPFSPLSATESTKPAQSVSTGFADFANFESQTSALSSIESSSPLRPAPAHQSGGCLLGSGPVPPPPAVAAATDQSADKYSALAELDELFRNDPATVKTVTVGSAFSPLVGGQNALENPFVDANSVHGSFSGGGFAARPTGSVFAGCPAGNPFFTANANNKPPQQQQQQDQGNLFASLNPFGDHQTGGGTASQHGSFNGSAKVPSSATTQNSRAQPGWNPFM